MELEYYKVEKQAKHKRFACPHNNGVLCSVKDCINCGWHPMVAKLRTEKLNQKLKEAEA